MLLKLPIILWRISLSYVYPNYATESKEYTTSINFHVTKTTTVQLYNVHVSVKSCNSLCIY